MSPQPITIREPREMAAWSDEARRQGLVVGFVPTMGALHRGHLSLMEAARERCDRVVVSIFVNPLQFDRSEDLDKYPRTFESDADACAGAGVAAIYAPTVSAMYPEGYQTSVAVRVMTKGLCGAHRPGHFDGVTTVVAKLFNAVKPHYAFFGEKDFQQLAVIRRMALDLNIDLDIVGCPTVREPDGLAMSSRNVHLNQDDRRRALCLWRALNRARQMADGGERDAGKVLSAARAEIEATPGARLEYLEIVDSTTLEGLARLDRPARMALAVWVGGTRLIDNAALD